MDVKSAFLDRFLEKEVYVEQPLRYEQDEHEDKVYKLESTLQIEVSVRSKFISYKIYTYTVSLFIMIKGKESFRHT